MKDVASTLKRNACHWQAYEHTHPLLALKIKFQRPVNEAGTCPRGGDRQEAAALEVPRLLCKTLT